eukprot:5936375-Pyramimonas_sp.AAC.1
MRMLRCRRRRGGKGMRRTKRRIGNLGLEGDKGNERGFSITSLAERRHLQVHKQAYQKQPS